MLEIQKTRKFMRYELEKLISVNYYHCWMGQNLILIIIQWWFFMKFTFSRQWSLNGIWYVRTNGWRHLQSCFSSQVKIKSKTYWADFGGEYESKTDWADFGGNMKVRVNKERENTKWTNMFITLLLRHISLELSLFEVVLIIEFKPCQASRRLLYMQNWTHAKPITYLSLPPWYFLVLLGGTQVLREFWIR